MKNDLPFLKAGHLPTLVSAFLYFDVSFIIWVLLGALGNCVAGEFALSPAQNAGMAASPPPRASLLRQVFNHAKKATNETTIYNDNATGIA